MASINYDALRAAIVSRRAHIEVGRLADVEEISWSADAPHLENVAQQLERVEAGEVEYLVVRADGHAVAKGVAVGPIGYRRHHLARGRQRNP